MSSRLRLIPSTALAVLALTTSGCAALGGEGSDPSDGLTVAAGFYPLVWVSEQVAGEHAEVVALSRPGQDAHDTELTFQARATVADADLVVISNGFQPAVDAAAAQVEDRVLDAATVLDFREVTDHDDHEHEGDDHEGDQHDESDEHAGHDHDHGDTDPHFWHDPLLMADLADAVAEDLSEVAPDLAEEFEANAADVRTRLEALDADYESQLASCRRSTVVVSHDAFGYLGRYGLEFEPIAGLSPGAEPTPADLARLRQLIDDEGVTTVFNEVLAPVALAESLARDAGVATSVLDPIEGVGDDTDEDYLSLMEKNLTALAEANAC